MKLYVWLLYLGDDSPFVPIFAPQIFQISIVKKTGDNCKELFHVSENMQLWLAYTGPSTNWNL